MQNADINLLGFLLVGLFIVTWVIAVDVGKLGHIEDRWARRVHADPVKN